MSLAVVIGVGLLGGAGAVGRFLLDHAVSARSGRAFPFGILAVNLSGAFLLGLLAGLVVPDDDTSLLLGTGLLGAYTTFSTWMFDTHVLAGAGRRRAAIVNVALSLAAGLAAVWLGRKLGTAL